MWDFGVAGKIGWDDQLQLCGATHRSQEIRLPTASDSESEEALAVVRSVGMLVCCLAFWEFEKTSGRSTPHEPRIAEGVFP